MARTERRAESRRVDRLFRLGDAFPRSHAGTSGQLPPGQCEIDSFPRYGTHFARRDPAVSARPSIELTGPGVAASLDGDGLRDLTRVEVVADFHCVAGWTTRGVHWEGVRFRDVYERYAGSRAGADMHISHIRVVGRDGFRAVLLLEDALADDVLIADKLNGEAVPIEHGAPFRLVSPSQYGYKSVKCLARIEFHTEQPSDAHDRRLLAAMMKAVATHPRGRVWHEERHRYFPGRSQRFLNLRVIHPFAYLLGYLGAWRSGRR